MMLKKLSLLSSEEEPSFSTMKDLFDFIDIRKDGVVDLHEWMQTFRKIDVIFEFLCR